MASVVLKAHYDGERIVLDEPFDLPLNAPLAVTVLSFAPESKWDRQQPKPDQRVDWTESAAFRLDRSGERVLSAEEAAALLAESQGDY